MNRRDFLSTAALIGFGSYSSNLLADSFSFNQTNYKKLQLNLNRKMRFIVVYLPGGASEMAFNRYLSTDINKLSKNQKNLYGTVKLTANGFWDVAGGKEAEDMLRNKTLSIVRTIYRTVDDNKSHGTQTGQNQRGHLDLHKAGISSEMTRLLLQKGAINESSIMPIISMSGDSAGIFSTESLTESCPLCKPAVLTQNLDNPYSLPIGPYGGDGDINASLMRKTAQGLAQKILDNYKKGRQVSDFIANIKNVAMPTGFTTPTEAFAQKLFSMVRTMENNRDSQFGFITQDAGYDMHSNFENQYASSYSAMMRANLLVGDYMQKRNINDVAIVYMTEFGRTADLNTAGGLDHGNTFNMMIVSNSPALKMGQIIGENVPVSTNRGGRVYLEPKAKSPHYEPSSIASLMYYLSGVDNPELLTNTPIISELIA